MAADGRDPILDFSDEINNFSESWKGQRINYYFSVHSEVGGPAREPTQDERRCQPRPSTGRPGTALIALITVCYCSDDSQGTYRMSLQSNTVLGEYGSA